MKKLLFLFTLLGCTCLAPIAYCYYAYNRSINLRAYPYAPFKMVPADSTLTTVFDGIEISAMDYAEITFAIEAPETFYNSHPYVISYGPSPRMRKRDFTPHSRQKLILADNAFFNVSYTDDEYKIPTIHREYFRVINDHPYHFPYEDNLRSDGLGNDIVFDFDLSDYECDFDIYIILIDGWYIFDNAFRNFKMSDNVKSIHLYMLDINVFEVGHNAFSSIPYFDSVNVKLMTYYEKGGLLPDGVHYWYKWSGDHSIYTLVHDDSFSENTYDKTPLITASNDERIAPFMRWCPKSFYKYFKNTICGVENVNINEVKADIRLNGKILTIKGARPGQTIQAYDIEGRNIGQTKSDNEGFASLALPHTGVVFVKVGQTVSKYVVL